MRKFILVSLLILFFIPYYAYSQVSKKSYVVGFYNMENLFDTFHDPGKNDSEYLPNSSIKWNMEKYQEKISNMAKVIRSMADDNKCFHSLIGLAEIENRHVLEDLVCQKSIAQANYQIVHYDSPDKRGIDVALLYRPDQFHFIESQCIPFDFNSKKIDFSKWSAKEKANFKTRDILMVRGLLDKQMIAVFVGHFPSRLGGKGQDLRPRAAEIMYEHALELMKKYPGIKIVCMGDMNDNPTDPSMVDYMHSKAEISQLSQYDFFSPFISMYKAGFGSLAYRGTWNIFDIIMVNKALCNNKPGDLHIIPITMGKYYAAIYHKPFMTQEEGMYRGTPKRTFSNGNFIGGYSDHYPTYIVLSTK